MDVGAELRKARTAAGLSQAELAERAGTTQSTISAYESGRKEPGVSTLERLLGVVGVSLRISPGVSPARRPSVVRNEHRAEILRLARRHGAEVLGVFGSVARGEDRPGSDLDLLVRFESGRSLVDHAALLRELGEALEVPVDVISAGGLTDNDPILADLVPL